jgi:cyanate permease
MKPSTLLVWIVFFCTMAAFYFILSWTPRLLNAAGLSAGAGLTGGVLLNLGGIAGCGLFAFAAARADTHRLLLGALIGSALLIVVFGLVMSRLDIALWTALLLGIIANAAMAGLMPSGHRSIRLRVCCIHYVDRPLRVLHEMVQQLDTG